MTEERKKKTKTLYDMKMTRISIITIDRIDNRGSFDKENPMQELSNTRSHKDN